MTQSAPIHRELSDKDLAYDRLAETFHEHLSDYDTQRRVEVLVDDFLATEDVAGCRILDVGAGLGFFSSRLRERGANVIPTDLAPKLVEKLAAHGFPSEIADALALVKQFGECSFDGVISSECIEHTPDPAAAIREMTRVLKPGGWLSISTPNLVWRPVVRAATAMKLRRFDGHENFLSWRVFHSAISEQCEIQRECGLHLFPFQIPLRSLSRLCDSHLQSLRGVMINMCALARKKS